MNSEGLLIEIVICWDAKLNLRSIQSLDQVFRSAFTFHGKFSVIERLLSSLSDFFELFEEFDKFRFDDE